MVLHCRLCVESYLQLALHIQNYRVTHYHWSNVAGCGSRVRDCAVSLAPMYKQRLNVAFNRGVTRKF